MAAPSGYLGGSGVGGGMHHYMELEKALEVDNFVKVLNQITLKQINK